MCSRHKLGGCPWRTMAADDKHIFITAKRNRRTTTCQAYHSTACYSTQDILDFCGKQYYLREILFMYNINKKLP